MAVSVKPAYIHPQGIVPDGMFFDGSMVQTFLDADIIWQCPDCGSEDPEFPTYGISGDDEEEEQNLRFIERVEVSTADAREWGW